MKKLIILLLGAFFAFPGHAGHGGGNLIRKKMAPVRKAPDRRYVARATEAGATWCSTLQMAYGWDRGKWVLDDTYRIEYDSRGLVTTQEITDAEGYVTRETNTWTESGRLATRLTEVAARQGAEFRNSSRVSREYDPVVASFITVNDQNVWFEGEWRPSNSYRQTVTRDDTGNVVRMERSVFFGGIFDPVYRIDVTYGAHGSADRIEVWELVNDYQNNGFAWNLSETYTDIVWENTDGQIVSVDNLFSGANRLASATVTDEDGLPMSVEAKYESDGSYSVSMRLTDDDVEISGGYELTPLDDYGSVDIHTHVAYTYPDGESETEYSDETYRYDAFGLILLEEVVDGGDDPDAEMVVSRTVGKVEYDPDHGYPLSWTVQEYDTEAMELENVFRAEYLDYIDPASGVEMESVEAEGTRWYTLQGVPVSAPTVPGIYLRVCGGKAMKIVL